jgi:hypothetical protein
MIKQNGMVMMTEKELENLISDGNKRTAELETRNKMLRAALIEIIKNNNIDKKTAYNHIITAIENVYNEDDEECIED